jgi:hypothetical protein
MKASNANSCVYAIPAFLQAIETTKKKKKKGKRVGKHTRELFFSLLDSSFSSRSFCGQSE